MQQDRFCYSFLRSDAAPQHVLVVLIGFLSYSRSHGCRKLSVNVSVQIDLGAFQVAAQVTLSQFPCKVGLRFAHRTADRSVVVVAFIGFVIAAEINPDEPVASQ
jgi:hypothetical protein